MLLFTVNFIVSRRSFCKHRRDFGFFCFTSIILIVCGVTQITTQRAHQFWALEKRERKSFIRKSKKLKNFA